MLTARPNVVCGTQLSSSIGSLEWWTGFLGEVSILPDYWQLGV